MCCTSPSRPQKVRDLDLECQQGTADNAPLPRLWNWVYLEAAESLQRRKALHVDSAHPLRSNNVIEGPRIMENRAAKEEDTRVDVPNEATPLKSSKIIEDIAN